MRKDPAQKIGILGGTFNPIHTAHLAMAQAALEQLKLNCVYFVPSYLPPHKEDKGLVPAKDRLAMVKLAVKGYPKFKTSDFEIKKGGRSYSIDTVKYFRSKLKPVDKLFFIIGQDSLNTLSRWKKIDQLVRLVQFVAVNRPRNKNIKSKYKVVTLLMPALDVSSSDIRKKIAQNKSVKYLLPEGVLQYIEKKGLYRD